MVDVLKATGRNWSLDKAPKLAAALAYYSTFALAPLLVVSIAVAGAVFDPDAARGQVVSQLRGLLGDDSAEAMEAVLERLRQPKSGAIATIIGVAVLIFGASGVFGELQDSFNVIWKVKKKPGRGILGTIRDRFLSMTMVLGLGFLLVVSLLMSAALAGIARLVHSGNTSALLEIAHAAISIAVIGGIFALLFRYLPDARTPWRHVLVGGFATSGLFTLGKFAIGAYLARGTTATTYGAAGAFLIVLLWVYYSSQILFFGAELTRALAMRKGRAPPPDSDAIRITAPHPARAAK